MVITNLGRSGLAVLLGSSIITRPSHAGIGDGSGAVTVNRTGLIAETDRNALTSVDLSQVQKTIFTIDFNSVEMSGTNLFEFGMFNNSAANSGTMWSVDNLPNGHQFDGTEELQLQITFEIF